MTHNKSLHLTALSGAKSAVPRLSAVLLATKARCISRAAGELHTVTLRTTADRPSPVKG